MSFLTLFFALMSCITMQDEMGGRGKEGNLDLSKRVEEWGSKETDEDQRLGPVRILPSKAESE